MSGVRYPALLLDEEALWVEEEREICREKMLEKVETSLDRMTCLQCCYWPHYLRQALLLRRVACL